MPIVGQCKLCKLEKEIGASDSLCIKCWTLRSLIANNPKVAAEIIREFGYTVTKEGWRKDEWSDK